jgi:predicted GNAT superfamily acetyltransferase
VKFEIRPLSSREDYEACVDLQDTIWGNPRSPAERGEHGTRPDPTARPGGGFNERVPPAILKLAQRLGGIASGAFDEHGRLLGFVFGMTGVVEGRPVHWSDMLAVLPDVRDRGIGEALKRHQRVQLLARGITLAQWTFDPLEARNAWLNFGRLGVTANQYVRDFYATSDSPIHRAIGTDRLVVDWQLDSERVTRRLNGLERPPAPEAVAHLPIINPMTRNATACAQPDISLDAPGLLLAVPASIQETLRASRKLALEWRYNTRAAFETYLPRGYTVTELVRYSDHSAYLLGRLDYR